MRKYLKWLSFLLVIVLCLYSAMPVFAHDRKEHDEDLEYVLFGEKDYKSTHPLAADKINALEDAVYLCVDQFNGSGKDALQNLQTEGIADIPDSIDDIDFKSNSAHRYYTHRGWDITYDKKLDKAHWSVRKKILVNTVDKELFSENRSFISKIPVLSSIFAKKELREDRQKCVSLSTLIYYVHIIGDHNEAEKYTALANIYPLTSLNDRDNPGIIPDLIQNCSILFDDQKDSYVYDNFMQELEDIESKSDKLTSSKGGINTEVKFKSYHQYADDLLELLATYIPGMLKKEDFFSQSFY